MRDWTRRQRITGWARRICPPGRHGGWSGPWTQGVRQARRGGWFPMATGFGGTYSAPLGQIQPGEEYSFLSPLSPSGVGREAFEAVLLTLPTAPLPPAGNEVGFVRGASYQSAHVS